LNHHGNRCIKSIDMDRARSRSPRGTSTVDEIVRLVHARERARLDKDWESADSIRQQLQDAGVTLFDKNAQWRTADGRSGRIPSFNELESSTQEEEVEHKAPESDGGLQAQIQGLVRQREQARATKNFEESDRIREELKAMGVELLDKEKLWKSSDGLQGIIMGYGRNAVPTDTEVRTLVIQREKARQASNYELSDIIREELKAVGITVSDKSKTWNGMDGRSGPVPSWGEIMGDVQTSAPVMMQAPAPHARNARAPVPAPRARGPSVQEQLMQAAREAAADPVTAARALQLLQQAADEVAAQRRMRAPPPRAPQRMATSASKHASTELDEALRVVQDIEASRGPASDDDIDWLVKVREKLRQNKDYRGADELRDSLRQNLGIELLEKEKRWTCTDGRQGDIPTWDQLS